MKKYTFLIIVALNLIGFAFLWGGMKISHAQEDMISASRVKDAMREMDCKKVSANPDVWTCEHARAFCIVLNPSNQAQLQCQFR
jgi:hypothetical protein